MDSEKEMIIWYVNAIDRLSNLPDVLLLHILSFMDTKFAVRTSVLSKRWNRLWTHLPSLNFSDESFTRTASFKNFIIHVLNHREATDLHSLSLESYGIIAQSLINRVVNYAVSHHVQQLYIYISFDYNSCLHLPPSLLNCQSLRILKLVDFKSITNLPNSLVFASLTTLHLSNVSLIYDANFCIDVFTSCMNLENLFLNYCYVNTHNVFVICGPQLVNLTISNLSIRRNRKKGKVMVSAPRLTSFNFTDNIDEGLANIDLGWSVDSCPNLDRVNMDVFSLYILEISHDQNQKREYIFNLINIFRGLSNAKSLTLSMDTIKALSMFPGLLKNQPSPFNNLKSLKVKVTRRMKSFIIPLHVMNFLLSSCPDVDMVVELLKA